MNPIPLLIRNNFCLHDLSPKCHLWRQEGGVTIDDDTGVILVESPDIQDSIIGHSEQLSLKKYCRKTALTACSSRFSPSGTLASTTTSMESRSVLRPSSWSSAMTWGLGVGIMSLSSITWPQWRCKVSPFSSFYKVKWWNLWSSGLRCRSKRKSSNPIDMSSQTILLLGFINFTPILDLFTFRSFWK